MMKRQGCASITIEPEPDYTDLSTSLALYF